MRQGLVVNKKIFLYALALLPVLSIKMVSVSIILFAIGSFVEFESGSYEKQLKTDIKLVALLSTPFFMYLIALIWTEDLFSGFKSVEKTLPFLIIPICIFIFKPFKTKESIISFFKVYIKASFILAALTILFLILNIEEMIGIGQKNNYLLSIKVRQLISEVPLIGEHSIYYSLILATAILLLYYNKFKSNFINTVFYITFILGLLIASSRGVLLGTAIVIYLIIFQSKTIRTKKQIIITLFSLAFFGTYFISPIKARVNEIIMVENVYPMANQYNSFSIRMAIYNCSLNLIPMAPLIGVGPADVQKALDNCYTKYKTSAFNEVKYNSHNQFFDYILSFGLIGFSIILYCLASFIKVSFFEEDKQHFNFLILMYLTFLFENILVRNTGIVLFVTFNSLFIYLTLLKKQLNDKG